MDDPLVVGERQGPDDRQHHPAELVRPEPPALPEHRFQGAALDVLGSDVEVALVAVVEDRDDVRVPEPGLQQGLAAEALDQVGVGLESREQDLEQHRPVEDPVASLVAGRDQPLLEGLEDFVALSSRHPASIRRAC